MCQHVSDGPHALHATVLQASQRCPQDSRAQCAKGLGAGVARLQHRSREDCQCHASLVDPKAAHERYRPEDNETVSVDGVANSEAGACADGVEVVAVLGTHKSSAADRLAAELAGIDLASDDTSPMPAQPPASNDESLRREVPPHHI